MADDHLPNESVPDRTYRARAARFGAERDRLARRARLLSHVRLIVFASAVIVALLLERRATPVLLFLLLLTIAGFMALVVLHQRTQRQQRWQGELAAVNEEGLNRIGRQWELGPVRPPSRSVDGHAYAQDLDLYGRASLSQLLGPVGTPAGARILDDWLLARAEPPVVRERQAAVRELAGLNELRDALAVLGRRTRELRHRDIERFLRWAHSPGWLQEHGSVRVLAGVLPIATWVLIGLHASGVVDRSVWLLPAAVSLVLYFTVGARARATFVAAFGREALFAHYPEMMSLVSGASVESAGLRRIQERLHGSGEAAHERLAELQRLMHLADLRSSSMHLPIFLLTMWDVHVLAALERWQRVAGAPTTDWLDALGEAEALAALAALAHDHPDWTYAVFSAPTDRVVCAHGLGHPLLADDVRVVNDVDVGPPGSFLLVTGSNMSGKSTLLRALGANIVLAQAGGPSCARSLLLPPLEVYTSIRVQDSLARGVSYFMAELERLKVIVDAADAVRADGTVTLLFLLDEILHGTNTAERRIAARRVIRHLVDSRAIGAATTHDLELADDPALRESARLVHFSESFVERDGGSTLHFDYRLREGLATSTNALELMRLVGLPAE